MLGAIAKDKLIEVCGVDSPIIEKIWSTGWDKIIEMTVSGGNLWYERYYKAIEEAGDNDLMKFLNALDSSIVAYKDCKELVTLINGASKRNIEINTLLRS